MLEILALYFLLKNVKKLAEEKGYSVLRLKISMVMTWFLAELTGMMVVQVYFPGNIFILIAIGLCMAYLSYLLLMKYWSSLPDLNEEEYE